MLHAELAAFKPHVWVNVHSGMEALFMPYGLTKEVALLPAKGAPSHPLWPFAPP